MRWEHKVMPATAIAFDRYSQLQDDDCEERILAAKAALGSPAVILGHHYQRDEVIVAHRRGWIVREHSQQEIREVYEIRAALEGFAAGLAAQRATDSELANIQAIHQDYIDTVSRESRGHQVEHNDAFHNAVIAAAKNTLLAQQIHRNSQYYFIHRISGFLTDEEVRGSIAGHESVVQALVARDADLAESTARALVLEGLAKVLAHVR